MDTYLHTGNTGTGENYANGGFAGSDQNNINTAASNFQRIDALKNQAPEQPAYVAYGNYESPNKTEAFHSTETTASTFGATAYAATTSGGSSEATTEPAAEATLETPAAPKTTIPVTEVKTEEAKGNYSPLTKQFKNTAHHHISAGSVIVGAAANAAEKEKKKQKVRFIAVTAVVAAVVLGLSVWGVVALVSNRNRVNVATTETPAPVVTTTSSKNEDEKKIEEGDITHKTDGVKEVVEPAKPETVAVETKAEDIPQTGPEEVLPFAMMLGTVVAFAGSTKVAKREA